jgi:hypothetical protein
MGVDGMEIGAGPGDEEEGGRIFGDAPLVGGGVDDAVCSGWDEEDARGDMFDRATCVEVDVLATGVVGDEGLSESSVSSESSTSSTSSTPSPIKLVSFVRKEKSYAHLIGGLGGVHPMCVLNTF